jgi:tryptophan-rich sensory protein
VGRAPRGRRHRRARLFLATPRFSDPAHRGRSPLAAGVEIVVLESTTVVLVVLAWPLSRLATLLLVPNAMWIAVASVLTWAIWARD